MITSVEVEHSSRVHAQKRIRSRFSRLLQGWQRKTKVHHYQSFNQDVNFFIEESTEHSGEHYMTAHHFGVKENDLIQIQDSDVLTTYKVLEIDYYSDPPEMWTARLTSEIE